MGVFKLIFKFKKRSHQDLLVSKIPSIYIGCVFELIFKVHSLQHKKNQSLNNRAIVLFKTFVPHKKEAFTCQYYQNDF